MKKRNLLKKGLVLLLTITMATVSFVGCGKTTGEGTGSEGKESSGNSLVIYTNCGGDGRMEWLTERAAKDGFDITIVNGTPMNRLIAEKNAPIADICWGLNSYSYEILKEEGVLEAFTPDWADEVQEGLNDADGYYHATGLQAILLCYDKNQLSEAKAPKDWPDLWTNSDYIGKYEYATNTAAGTFQMFLAGILSRYADEDGYLGVSEEGWKQVELYYDNGVTANSGVDLYAHISDSTSPIIMGEMWSSGITGRDEQYGTKTGYVVPEVGVPFGAEALALVKGSEKAEEAQRFINWFGSAEIQAEYATEFDALPANTNAQDAANDLNKTIAKLPQQDIDWTWVAEYVEAWCEEIELMYK